MLRNRAAQGFTLVELMLAALLGTFLCGVVFQLLFAETRHGGALAESLQLKQWQRRTLQLVKGDLERASRWQIDPDPSGRWPCALADRQPKLAIPQQTAPILWCTAWDRRRLRSGAVMC